MSPRERFPTKAAIDSLAKRFDLPNHPGMQDWAYEVSDPERIGEFLDAYLQEGMSEDERFTVMQTIIDSSERNPIPLEEQPQWAQIQQELRHNIALHASTIFYWASLRQEPDAQPDRLWRVTPSMRTIVQEMPSYFSSQGEA